MTTKQIIINTVVFAAGAAIGSAVTWKIMKTRCDQHIREEVETFKKDWPKYAKGQNDDKVEPNDYWDGWNGCEEEDDDEDDYDPDVVFDYHNLAKRYDTIDNGEEGGGDYDGTYPNGPVVITPDEFNNMEQGWSMYALTYYAGDGVLADDWLVEKDIEDTIGEGALENFGEYSDEDVVHVRNEQNEAHYEVVRDPRRYADVLADSNLRAGMNAY